MTQTVGPGVAPRITVAGTSIAEPPGSSPSLTVA